MLISANHVVRMKAPGHETIQGSACYILSSCGGLIQDPTGRVELEATEQIPDKLQPRPGDEQLPFEQLTQISIFRQLAKGDQAKLKGKPGRGAVVLRKYAPGDVICSQGEAGWSAFYLITTEDLRALRDAEGGGASRTGEDLDTIRARAQRLTEAREADGRLDELHPELRRLTPAEKRNKASELPEDEPRAAWLRASADGDEWRAKAEVSFDFPQTRRKRGRGGGRCEPDG